MPEPKDGLLDPKNPVTPAPEGAKPQATPNPEGDKTGTPTQGQEKTVPYGALHEEREKRKESDARMEQIKALYGDRVKFDTMGNVLPPEVQPNQPQAPQQDNVQSYSDVQKKLDEMWDSDPKQAVRAEISMAINWFDQQSAAVDFQRDSARSRFKDFVTWESEINTYLRRLPLQQRTQPGIIDMAYNYVKGSKIDQILAREREEIARKLAAGESVQGLGAGAAGTPPPTGGPSLSDQERQAAAAMAMTEEDYIKYRVRK